MTKVILNPVTNLQNENSAITTINQNSDRIEIAMENTLSRDGTQPNEMNSHLDMNNNRIYNLPKAASGTEPIRYQDFQDLIPELIGAPGPKGDTGEQGPPGPAGPGAEGANSFPTFNSVELATVANDVDYIVINGYAALGDGGQVHAKKVLTEPTHLFKVESANNVWFEFIPDPYFRPEMLGYFPADSGKDLTTLVSSLTTNLPSATLFLSEGIWYSSTTLDAYNLPITGPGTKLVTYIYMAQVAGDNWFEEAHFDSGADLRREEKSTSARSQHTAFTSVTSSGSVSNITYLATNLTLVQDGMGAFQHSLSGAFWPRPGRYLVRGVVTWESNASGLRIVSLTRNGLTSGEILSQRTVPALSGAATTQEFEFEVETTTQGDLLGILLWQSSAVTLAYDMSVTIEALYQKPIAAVGSRVGLCAGPWADVLTAYGSVEALADHMQANYDSYIFCNVLASNSGNGVWPDTPTKTWYNCVGAWTNSVLYTAGMRVHDVDADQMVICLITHTSSASGTFAADWAANPTYWRVADQPLDFPYVASAPWPEFGEVVRLIKKKRPEFEVFLYISAPLDTLYVDHIGAPYVPYDGSRGFLNVVHFMDRYDRMFPEADGYFFDFFSPSYLTPQARNQVIQLTKERNKKAVCNTVSIGQAVLQFIAECPYIGRGDGVLNEGFEYDAGVSVSANTDAFLAELLKHRARGIRNFAFVEETSVSDIVPSSPKLAAAKFKFDINYVPGDCLGHSWASYTTVV